MKIGHNILLSGIFLFLLMGFVSCSDHEDIGGEDRAGDSYLSFRLNTNSSETDTRSVGKDVGTTAERKVSTVHLLIYAQGGENSELLHNMPIKATTNGENAFSGEDVAVSYGASDLQTKPLKLDKGNYQAIALINAPSSVLDKAEDGSILKDMLDAVEAVSTDFHNNNGENFFMSNAGGMKMISESDFYEKESGALSFPVSIPVDRLLAKVLVYENTTQKIPIKQGGTLESLVWGLDATNKQTYLIRQADYLLGGTLQESGFHAERKNVYAKDPNFTGNKDIIANPANKAKHFGYLDIDSQTGFQSWIPYEDKDKPAAHYQYVLENTVSKEDQNEDITFQTLYMTQVLVKATITDPGKLSGVTNYYSYSYEDGNETKWIVFTHEQALSWIAGTYPGDMVVLKDNEVFKKANALADSPFDFKAGGSAPGKYVAVDIASGERLTWHKDGLNVYRIPIKHFGVETGIGESDYGHYGVVRNNTYKIVISSINGPGINTGDEGYLSAKIVVNPWFERGWNEGGLNPEND